MLKKSGVNANQIPAATHIQIVVLNALQYGDWIDGPTIRTQLQVYYSIGRTPFYHLMARLLEQEFVQQKYHVTSRGTQKVRESLYRINTKGSEQLRLAFALYHQLRNPTARDHVHL